MEQLIKLGGADIIKIAGGRDNPQNFESFVMGYGWAFDELSAMGINPRKIFIGACGYGADVLAAHRRWPEAQITAVSVLDTPKIEVKRDLGNLLTFQERTILDYLEQANHDFSLRGFDLVVVFSTTTQEIREWRFVHLVHKILNSKGYIFHSSMGASPMDIWAMDVLYDRIPLSENLTRQEYFLWRSSI